MIPVPWIGLFRRLRGDIRYCLANIAILAAGVLFIVAAAGLGVAGGYLWLSTLMPSHLAALAAAGGLFLIGAGIISVARVRHGSQTPKPDAPGPAPEADVEILSQRMMQAALAEVAKAPIKAAFAAVALGVIVGLLRVKKSP